MVEAAGEDQNVALVTGWPVPDGADPSTYDPADDPDYDPLNPTIQLWTNTADPNPGSLYSHKEAKV